MADREIVLLEEAGASVVGVFRTGPWLLELSAREFFDRVIREPAPARGHRRRTELRFRSRPSRATSRSCGPGARESGIDFEVVEPTVIDGQPVSSSLIRQCLSEGRVEEAAQFLGRPHRIRGKVDHGAGRGAGLGFPTINLGAIDTLVPLDGVYAGLAWLGGQGPPWPAACNIGPNPTFGESARKKIEAHLIGFSGDLYGKTVELDFLERLRGTRKFSGLRGTARQIHADIEQTRQICAVGSIVRISVR